MTRRRTVLKTVGAGVGSMTLASATTSTATAQTSVSESSATAFDSRQSESGVNHESFSGVDGAAANVVEKGWPYSDWSATSIPAPELHLTLTEDSGSTAQDVSGNSNDFTITEATIGQAGGPWNHSHYSFDGTNDTLDNANFDLSGFSDLTVAVWFRTSTSYPDSSEAHGIIAWNETGSFGEITIGIGGGTPEGDDELLVDPDAFGVKATDGSDIAAASTTDAVTDGTWHLGIVVLDSATSEARCYLDGGNLQESTSGWNGFGPVDACAVGNAPRWDNFYQGDIQAIAVWDAVLTSSQMDELWDAAVAGSDYWTDKKTAVGSSTTIDLTTSTSIPTGTSIDVELFEDVAGDQSGANTDALGNSYDNSASVSLSGGMSETNTLSGFDGGGATNEYWLSITETNDGTDPTQDSPELSSWSIDTDPDGATPTDTATPTATPTPTPGTETPTPTPAAETPTPTQTPDDTLDNVTLPQMVIGLGLAAIPAVIALITRSSLGAFAAILSLAVLALATIGIVPLGFGAITLALAAVAVLLAAVWGWGLMD